jgi:flagellar motor switch/type III secretory pathway protein FliN
MAVGTVTRPAIPQQRAPGEASGNLAPDRSQGVSENQAEEARWRPVLDLPCQLTVDISLPHFRVADILRLQTGTVIGTDWRVTRDVPLCINGTLVGLSEFEVIGNRLAVRLTELA